MKGLLSSIIMVFLILQWNARSLISNGQEFKRYIEKLDVKPEIICIQETWMKSHLDFKIVGYNSVRLDRNERQAGGCATFIKEGILYERVPMNYETSLEIIVIEIWVNKRKMTIINLYNPCTP